MFNALLNKCIFSAVAQGVVKSKSWTVFFVILLVFADKVVEAGYCCGSLELPKGCYRDGDEDGDAWYKLWCKCTAYYIIPW